jgi:hypothetical protein
MSTESSPLTDGRLRLVYIAGIALNAIALTAAATTGQPIITLTFGFVIVYLGFRYWLIVTS